MRRITTSIITLLLCILVVTAAPVSATHSDGFSDGFEDEPADTGLPEDWETEFSSSQKEVLYNVTTDRANTGSQSFFIENQDSNFGAKNFRPAYQPSANTTANASFSFYQPTNPETEAFGLTFRATDDGIGLFDIDVNNGDLNSDGITITTGTQKGEWVDVTVFNFDFTNNEFDVTWDSPSDSGTKTDIDMQTSLDVPGYNETEFYVSNDVDNRLYIDDFSIEGQGGLEGYVTDPNDDPLANVNVTAYNTTGGTLTEVATTQSNASGNWSLHVPNDDYELVYDTVAYYQAIDNITHSGTTTDVGQQILQPVPTAYQNASPGDSRIQETEPPTHSILVFKPANPPDKTPR